MLCPWLYFSFLHIIVLHWPLPPSCIDWLHSLCKCLIESQAYVMWMDLLWYSDWNTYARSHWSPLAILVIDSTIWHQTAKCLFSVYAYKIIWSVAWVIKYIELHVFMFFLWPLKMAEIVSREGSGLCYIRVLILHYSVMYSIKHILVDTHNILCNRT